MHPNSKEIYPNPQIKELIYLKNITLPKNITVGDFTYYDDPKNEINNSEFLNHVSHHYEFIGDKLIIGKFCSIAKGIEFIMNGANHAMSGITAYPFNIMGGEWSKFNPERKAFPFKGDTVVGNDVWIGQNVTILPGIKIGNGAIIGANSTVTRNVPDYAIVGGNPANIIRYRFKPELIVKLNELKWWDKDFEWITKHIYDLVQGDISLESINKMLDS